MKPEANVDRAPFHWVQSIVAERDAARAEVVRLTAERDRLRAQLVAVTGVARWAMDEGDGYYTWSDQRAHEAAWSKIHAAEEVLGEAGQ